MELNEIFRTAAATVGSALVMFIITKLIGNKQISQLTLFDYITGITIGSIAAEMSVSDEVKDLWQPVIAMILYGAIGLILTWLTMKSLRCRKFISGTPLLLIDRGKLYPENLKTAKLDIDDLLTRARTAGYFDITKIDYAIFESTGAISFMPMAKEAPLTPIDLGYEKEADKLVVNLIMDGIVMEENLRRCGKEIKWLSKQLRDQGYSSPTQVFLAVVDKNDNVTIYPQSEKQDRKEPFD